MKKHLNLLIIILLTFSVNAQQTYVNFTFNYGLSSFKSRVETYYNSKNDNQEVLYNQPAFSLGQGLYFGFGIDHYFQSNIGVEMEMLYHKGSPIVFNQQTMIMSVVSDVEKVLYGNRFLINPSVIIQIEESKITPYIKFGPSVGIIMQEFEETKTINTDVAVQKWKYNSAVSWGMNSSFGVRMKVHNKFQVEVHIAHNAMVYSPSVADLTYSTVNGVSNMSTLNTNEKRIEFVDWTNDEFNQNPPDVDKATPMSEQTFSYHHLSLGLSLVMSLGDK